MIDVRDISPGLKQEGNFQIQFLINGLLPFSDLHFVDSTNDLQMWISLSNGDDVIACLDLNRKDAGDT